MKTDSLAAWRSLEGWAGGAQLRYQGASYPTLYHGYLAFESNRNLTFSLKLSFSLEMEVWYWELVLFITVVLNPGGTLQ